jgi:hypothetical protein
MALFYALFGGKLLMLALTAVLLHVLRSGGKLKDEPSSSMADVYNSELTPLQQHAAFFDRNKDGIIYPSETYEGESVTRAMPINLPKIYTVTSLRLKMFASVMVELLLGRVTRDRVRSRGVCRRRRLHQQLCRAQDRPGMQRAQPTSLPLPHLSLCVDDGDAFQVL